MSTGGIAVGLFLVVIVALWALSPWIRRPGSSIEEAERDMQFEHLRILYERVLTNIRDLDEDYSTGKIGKTAYETDREMWVERGVQVLRALDEQDAEFASTVADAAAEDEDAIESAVAAYRERIGQ